MKALRIVSSAPPRLEVVDLPKPQPGIRQALVRVITAGVNRADLWQARGMYPPPPGAPADIPGLEFNGVVESLGPECSLVTAPQRVFGICSGGAHAQYIISHEELLMPVPKALDDVHAAAVPEAYITSHDALVTQCAMQPGEYVLIHAVGSSVGLAALDIVLAWGCVPSGTSRSSHKLDKAREFAQSRYHGRKEALVFCRPDTFGEEVLKATAGTGADIILDPIGGAYFERNINSLALCGRLMIIATLGGTTVTLPLPVLMHKRLRLIGTMLRTRSLEEKAAASRAFELDVLPKLASGELKPIVDRTFPLEEAAEAYAYVEQNKNFGKVVLTMFGTSGVTQIQ
jgi:NADPH:quinone reductase-like Zn-dependent oxidoreductase